MIIFLQNYTMRFQMFHCEDMRKNTQTVLSILFRINPSKDFESTLIKTQVEYQNVQCHFNKFSLLQNQPALHLQIGFWTTASHSLYYGYGYSFQEVIKFFSCHLPSDPFNLIAKIKKANNLYESIFMDVYSSIIMYYTKVMTDEVNYVGAFFYTIRP